MLPEYNMLAKAMPNDFIRLASIPSSFHLYAVATQLSHCTKQHVDGRHQRSCYGQEGRNGMDRTLINHAFKAIHVQTTFNDQQVNDTLSKWYPFANPCFVCIAPPP